MNPAMELSERPKSRLADGRVNPAYLAYRKELKAQQTQVAAPEPEEPTATKGLGEWLVEKNPTALTFDEALEKAFEAPATNPEPEAIPESNWRETYKEPFSITTGETLSATRELRLRVVKLARNSSFVLCALDGVCVPVRVKRGSGPKLVKKDIRVERAEDGTLHHLP